MEQQNKNEEKSVRIFHAENMLRNKYGLTSEASQILSKIIVDLSDNIYENYDYGKVKHIMNAQSNLGIATLKPMTHTKIKFYIGLMDKNSFSYKISKENAINKVIDILGDCTIQEGTGAFTRTDNIKIQTKTLIVTKYLEKYDGNFVHYKTQELKQAFNQDSVLTEATNNCLIELNNENEEYVKEIESIMKEYSLNWSKAVDAYNSGLF